MGAPERRFRPTSTSWPTKRVPPRNHGHTWIMPRLVDAVVQPGALSGTQQPEIFIDEQLLLRPWDDGDVPAVVAAYAEPDIQAWNLYSIDEAEAHEWISSWSATWTAETDAAWAIAKQSDRSVVGRVALRSILLPAGSAEVTYWVASHYRRRGAASSATMAVSRWAFGSLGLHRLELMHSVQNVPSCGVAMRAGFVSESTRRSSLLHADGWHDMHLHALINPADA
jgi:ribosomal-protein-alanine N-acetyltransferase